MNSAVEWQLLFKVNKNHFERNRASQVLTTWLIYFDIKCKIGKFSKTVR